MLPGLPFTTPNEQKVNEKTIKELLVNHYSVLSSIENSNSRRIAELKKILKLLNRPESEIRSLSLAGSNALEDSRFFEIRLVRPLPKVICKSKYFQISLELIESEHKIQEEERIKLSICLYTEDSNPQKILHTMQGRDIFRGDTLATLAHDKVEHKHLAHFKLQICEVSSHFVGGTITLCIEPDQKLLNRGIVINPLKFTGVKVWAKSLKNH